MNTQASPVFTLERTRESLISKLLHRTPEVIPIASVHKWDKAQTLWFFQPQPEGTPLKITNVELEDKDNDVILQKFLRYSESKKSKKSKCGKENPGTKEI